MSALDALLEAEILREEQVMNLLEDKSDDAIDLFMSDSNSVDNELIDMVMDDDAENIEGAIAGSMFTIDDTDF